MTNWLKFNLYENIFIFHNVTQKNQIKSSFFRVFDQAMNGLGA